LTVFVHAFSLADDSNAYSGTPVPAFGALPAIVARVSGQADVLDRASRGLPEGAGLAEAVAVRARRDGADVRWGEPDRIGDPAGLIAFCRERGCSAVELLRADPSLTPEMQIGTWFDAGYRRRLARRAALLLPRSLRDVVLRDATEAFWSAVRAAASTLEWQSLTRTSYVGLLYHRLAGDGKPEQEKLDIAPELFATHLRFLRLLGFRPLSADEVIAFHRGELTRLPRRSFALTLDDGTSDCATPLLRAGWASPQLFVCTKELGGKAYWLDGEAVLSWEDVIALTEAGVAIGAHGRHHRRLTSLEPDAVADELGGSLADLRERLSSPRPIVAYPHGSADEAVWRAAGEAGFEAAYTTAKGRNGLGSNRYALRRVSVYGYDRLLAILWKASTGEAVPAFWERWRLRRLGLSRWARRTMEERRLGR
jgi:peptidoglycan/xylan/chitin deacetylase (PgdA/CDA1 family)